MEARRRTWFDERGLIVAGGADGQGTHGPGDRSLPFYAGAMHYWRVPPARWAACLRAIHGLGLTVVETYVPWRVHEPERGKLAWTGQNDLARFISAARTAGLAVVLRPGPHVNAELTSFGMPDWVLADPACQAKTSRGTPAWMPTPPRAWPLPSYASNAFRERVRAWYAAVAEVVRPHLAPQGPVVAIGVDNEAQMFFRLGAYDHDYHPDAIAWWREHLAAELPDLAAAEPPRESGDPATCAAWVRFKDVYIARALGDFAAMLDDVGLGEVARFHNLPPGHHGLYDLRRIQTAIGGPVGIDAYTARREFAELRRRGAALAGNARPIPIAFEVGVGFFPWFPPLSDGSGVADRDRERDQLLTLLAAGTRGFNLFMAVERDRYYGAAIDQHGKVETHAGWIRTLVAALNEVDWPSLRRQPAVALVDCKADARFGLATCAIDPMTPVLADVLGIGPGGAAELGTDAGAIEARRWQTAIVGALEIAQVPYAIVDESASAEELATYRAVIVPTGDRVDRALWQRLAIVAERVRVPAVGTPVAGVPTAAIAGSGTARREAATAQRRTTIVIGPRTPTKDELDRPLDEPVPRRLGRIRDGSLDDLAGLAADLASLVHPGSGRQSQLSGPGSWQIERPEGVRVHAFAAGDVTRVVFVINDQPKAATAVVLADDDARQLRDPFTGERIAVTSGRASVLVTALGVRMFVVE